MRLNLIFAHSHNKVIGLNNSLPWHLPEDLTHFKNITWGQPVIMGRKTWESLPKKFRPLPNRTNIVITRQTDWKDNGANVVNSLEQAIELCYNETEAWVIGGAEIYAQSLQFAQRAVITEIDADYDGDSFSPNFDKSWIETHRESHVSMTGLKYSFLTLEKFND
jgi:dihydrofolate reductase